MSKRKLIGILIILTGFIIIGALLYFMFFNNRYVKKQIDNISQKTDRFRQKISPVSSDKETPEKTKSPKVIIHKEKQEDAKKQNQEESLKFVAISFAERFGSYSNQSNFQNIIDLKPFMSEKMKKWADSYVTQLRQKQKDVSSYYSIITKAITAKVENFSPKSNSAVVTVSVIRNENKTDGSKSRFSQDIILNFIKEGSAWRVDKVKWQ